MDKIVINGKELSTSVAITEEEHNNGLMYEKQAYVMTFPYDTLAIRKFWMKNTQVPLDIIFLRAGKVVDVCRGLPLSEEFIGPNIATDMVIEMPLGMARACGIFQGTPVDVKFSTKTLLKKFVYDSDTE